MGVFVTGYRLFALVSVLVLASGVLQVDFEAHQFHLGGIQCVPIGLLLIEGLPKLIGLCGQNSPKARFPHFV